MQPRHRLFLSLRFHVNDQQLASSTEPSRMSWATQPPRSALGAAVRFSLCRSHLHFSYLSPSRLPWPPAHPLCLPRAALATPSVASRMAALPLLGVVPSRSRHGRPSGVGRSTPCRCACKMASRSASWADGGDPGAAGFGTAATRFVEARPRCSPPSASAPVNGSTTMVQGAEDGAGEDAAAPAWVMACATTAAVQFQVKSSWTEEDRC